VQVIFWYFIPKFLHIVPLRTGHSRNRLGTHIERARWFSKHPLHMVPFCLPLSLYLSPSDRLSLPFTSWESPNCWQLFEQQQSVVVNVYKASEWARHREGACVCWMLMKSRCWVSVRACGCVCVCVCVCTCLLVCPPTVS